MREDLDKALVRDFPNLYRDRYGSMQETCICWGFECGSGWEPLIRELSGILERMIIDLPEELRSEYRAAQVKEKFSELRFYMNASTIGMDDIIYNYERKSRYVCEECGAPGSLRERGRWLMTRCDECFDENR